MAYLKFVKEVQGGNDIFQQVMEIDSPENYPISGVRVWPVHGSHVISMPVAGGWLTSLEKTQCLPMVRG